MTEQELREKIAKLIDSAGLYDTGISPRGLADQILALIKEAGYKSPEEIRLWQLFWREKDGS